MSLELFGHERMRVPGEDTIVLLCPQRHSLIGAVLLVHLQHVGKMVDGL
jgi:hypothetical protein